MEIVCTTCCKAKRTDPGLLPARQRYLSPRIDFTYQESLRLGLPFLIFSGRYGLIGAEDEIPYYDKFLAAEEVPEMAALLQEQLVDKNISRIIFYGKPKYTAGWEPYYDALEQACESGNIHITNILVDYD